MTRRTNSIPTGAAAALVAALVLTGCSGGSEDPQDTTTAPATTTSEPPATTTEAPDDDEQITTAEPELSAEEQDEADIEETLVLYTAALSDAFTGDESVEGIYPFSRDTAREKWVTEVMAAQAQSISFTGAMEVHLVEVTIDGDTAEAVGCLDVSDVEAVNENGDSVVTDERLDQTLQDYVLERDDSAQLGWYIVEDTNRNEPCDG